MNDFQIGDLVKFEHPYEGKIEVCMGEIVMKTGAGDLYVSVERRGIFVQDKDVVHHLTVEEEVLYRLEYF